MKLAWWLERSATNLDGKAVRQFESAADRPKHPNMHFYFIWRFRKIYQSNSTLRILLGLWEEFRKDG